MQPGPRRRVSWECIEMKIGIGIGVGRGGRSGVQYETPDYANVGGTGDRRVFITVTSNFGTVSGTLSDLVDGNRTAETVYLFDTPTPGKYVRFHFDEPVIISEVSYWRAAGGAFDNGWHICVCQWQVSTDGVNFVNSGGTFTPNTPSPDVQSLSILTPCTDFQLVVISGDFTYYEAPSEFEFKIGNPI